MGVFETNDQSGPLRSRLRLIPLSAVLPMLSAPATTPAPPRPDRDERRRTAEGLVELCAQVLRGRHPLAAIQRKSDRAAFGQFAALYRRFRSGRADAAPVSLRLRHSDTDASGGLTMVAILNTGDQVRAMSLCARDNPPAGWRLTRCQLVEPRPHRT